MNAAYRYNAEGVRSSKTVNGSRTDYIYSGSRLLAWRDAQGWHDNIYLNGEILATVDNGQVHYHENDYQGKALRLVDENGNTVWTADWQPYRESDITHNGINNPQRFAGQILDKETGLYYNHFREYDPQTGRYTQSDPIGLNGGVNTYAYVGGNPVMWIDPLGLDSKSEAIACAVGGAGLGTIAGGSCAAGGVVTFGGTTVATPACVAGGVAAGCAGGIAIDRAVNGVAEACSDIWNWAFNESAEDENESSSSNKKLNPVPHANDRKKEAKYDPNRNVGDVNDIKQKGKEYIDSETGNTVHVKGNKVVITDGNGNQITQFKNSRKNTENRIRNGRWRKK